MNYTKGFRFTGASVLLLLGLLLSIAMTSPASSGPDIPRFGPVPEEAMKGQTADQSMIPEFVSVQGADGSVAGYVQRDDLFGPNPGRSQSGLPPGELAPAPGAPASPEEAVAMSGDILSSRLEVFDRQARQIGYWYHEVGFVSNEQLATPGFDVESLREIAPGADDEG